MCSSLLPTLGNLLAIPSRHRAPGVLRTRVLPCSAPLQPGCAQDAVPSRDHAASPPQPSAWFPLV